MASIIRLDTPLDNPVVNDAANIGIDGLARNRIGFTGLDTSLALTINGDAAFVDVLTDHLLDNLEDSDGNALT